MIDHDLVNLLVRQKAWSLNTFGPGARWESILDHIRLELKEIEAQPEELVEWVDVVLLALDGALRAGHTPLQILKGILDKQAINRARDYPDWRTTNPTKAMEHIRCEHKRTWLHPGCGIYCMDCRSHVPKGAPQNG